jgi:hypothetical protein
MKIIVRGILQKLLKYWTIRRRDDRPSNPVTQRIILEIDWFYIENFGQIWFNLIKRLKKNENLMIYFNDYCIRNTIWSSLIHFDSFWTDLIQSDQKINKVENLIFYFNDYLIRNSIWSSLIHFDPFWTELI